jgi:hypothetical protein
MAIRPGFNSELNLVANGPTTWALTLPLVWTGTKGDTFVVPTGFVTDFATVPRFLHWEVSPYGAYTRAAVLHDWLLLSWPNTMPGGKVAEADGVSPGGAFVDEPPATSRDCDGIFRRVMEDLGVPWAKRWTMWTAVRWASLFNSRRAYGRRIGQDLPAMLGMTLLALPVSLPGALGVLISLGLLKVVNMLARIGRA